MWELHWPPTSKTRTAGRERSSSGYMCCFSRRASRSCNKCCGDAQWNPLSSVRTSEEKIHARNVIGEWKLLNRTVPYPTPGKNRGMRWFSSIINNIQVHCIRVHSAAGARCSIFGLRQGHGMCNMSHKVLQLPQHHLQHLPTEPCGTSGERPPTVRWGEHNFIPNPSNFQCLGWGTFMAFAAWPRVLASAKKIWRNIREKGLRQCEFIREFSMFRVSATC